MINRDIAPSVQSRLADEKAIILLGPRQVGKSTLLKQLAPALAQKVVEWSGDDADVRIFI